MPTITELDSIVEAIEQRHRFLIVSHARPDGDSIGSQLSLAYALRDLGKTVQVINHDPAPPFLQSFPGVKDIVVRETAEGEFDAAIVLECGSLERTEVAGLDRYFLIQHRPPPGQHHVRGISTGLMGAPPRAEKWSVTS